MAECRRKLSCVTHVMPLCFSTSQFWPNFRCLGGLINKIHKGLIVDDELLADCFFAYRLHVNMLCLLYKNKYWTLPNRRTSVSNQNDNWSIISRVNCNFRWRRSPFKILFAKTCRTTGARDYSVNGELEAKYNVSINCDIASANLDSASRRA